MVSLSTAQPSVGGSAPSLPTRIARFKRPKPRPQLIHLSAKMMMDEYDPTIVSKKVPLVLYIIFIDSNCIGS